ncbi:MAG: DUF3108 domain-containing protein [Bacteroidia bacterium]|nr:DUF3108 domain-containing protein [Bacteroidia bacterium]
MKQKILLLFCVLTLTISAQNTAIGSNEELVFTASYNISGLLTDIAQVKMETSEIKTSNSTLLRLKCTATTFNKWDSFFKIRDLYESYVSTTSLNPYLYKRDISEGGYYKFMQYKYDRKSNTVASIKRKRRKDGSYWDENNTLNISSDTKDIVSLLYNIRNLDIHKASPGDQNAFKVLFDNETFTVNVRYVGQETIKTNIGTKACYKLSISINNSDVLKGAENNLLWFTADKNKIPVFAKFKIPVGNGELKIISASGLKN